MGIVNFGGVTIIFKFWTDFKSIAITGKGLNVQYEEDSEIYDIFALDTDVVYECVIYKGTVPESIVNGGYSQAQNDSDETDFTGNYQSSANKVNLSAAVGPVAHDAAVSGNPVLIAGRASTATPSAVSADGDVARLWVDRTGAAVVVGGAPHDSGVVGNPVLMGAYASATAPTAVSDGDAVRIWASRNGAVQVADGLGSLTVDHTAVADTTITTLQQTGAGTVNSSWSSVTSYGGCILNVHRTTGSLTITTVTVAWSPDASTVTHTETFAMSGTAFSRALPHFGANIRVSLTCTGSGTSDFTVALHHTGGVAAVTLSGPDLHDDPVAASPILFGGYGSDVAPTATSADGDLTRLWLDKRGAVVNVGDIAHDTADAGNPQKIGFKAKNALPTAVANNDRADGICDLWGRQMTTHIDPAQQVWKSFNATTTQTGTDVWSPTSGKKIAITSIVIGTYATTAARVILWFGDNADTTYTAGTDQLVLAASFAPSATSKPGLVFTPPVPIFCTTADRELHITTDAGISIDVTVYGYEW